MKDVYIKSPLSAQELGLKFRSSLRSIGDEYLVGRIAMLIVFPDYSEIYGECDFKWEQL